MRIPRRALHFEWSWWRVGRNPEIDCDEVLRIELVMRRGLRSKKQCSGAFLELAGCNWTRVTAYNLRIECKQEWSVAEKLQ